MKRSFLPLLGLALLPGLAWGVELEDLRPGLVAAHRDSSPRPAEVLQPEPGVALSLAPGQSPHPRLGPGGVSAWSGYINLLRGGTYRFQGVLQGKVRVSIDGKEVLAGESAAPKGVTGPEVKLEEGLRAFAVVLHRPAGGARLELRWQGPGFIAEPVPPFVLFHDPGKAPARLVAEREIEKGRFLAEEHSCAGCHRPEKEDRLAHGLHVRQGPTLTGAGERLYAGWVYHWLLDPNKLRPGAAMPRLFADDDRGRAEAYAVASFLAALGKKAPEPPAMPDPKKAKETAAQVEQGKRYFTSLGCAACHDEPGKGKEVGSFYHLAGPGGHRIFPLGALGSKTSEKVLTAYLQNPHATDPSGRMPSLNLSGKETGPLVKYLLSQRDEKVPVELPPPPSDSVRSATLRDAGGAADAWQKLPANKLWQALGQHLVQTRGCLGCHDLQPKVKGPEVKAPPFAVLRDGKKHTSGCLAQAGKTGKAPDFGLPAEEKKALARFLAEGSTGPGTPALAHDARVTLQRFNCLACHTRDGEGGLSTQLVEQMRKYEKVENAEALIPPTLTGVAHKLHGPWLGEVVTKGRRVRPWMSLVMPAFGEQHAGKLAHALASLEGTSGEKKPPRIETTAARITTGRLLVGKSGFGCISCHDLAGIPNTGTRGPDLASSTQRVRYDWYLRWMHDAQRLSPGTRMPTVFGEGKSPLPKVLGGDVNAQAEALWVYMALAPSLPLPEGIDRKGVKKAIVLEVGDRPYVLRTFMPQAGSRAYAVGYPGGVSVAYDAHACRLAYGWSGGFLDADPVWNGRGGQPARLLGPRFWSAPQGHPWGLGSDSTPPDFAARASDFAYGGPQGEKVFKGVKKLEYEGHELDRDGYPAFLSHVEGLHVRERPEPLQKGAALGVRRAFTLAVPEKGSPWFLAGTTEGEPRILDARGQLVKADLKATPLTLPPERFVLLPQGGGPPAILGLPETPAGTQWVLAKGSKGWSAYVRLPRRAGEARLTLDVWAPFKDEPALIKDLFTER